MTDPTQFRLQPFSIQPQPDDTTCGPTCLHAVYEYYGDTVPLGDLRSRVPELEDGGTLGVLLGIDALARGHQVRLVTWNLRVFDPTWFESDAPPLRERLLQRAAAKHDDAKLCMAAQAYADFLAHGGQIEFRDLTQSLLMDELHRGIPILTGLSATFLYREARQRPTDDEPDDVAGEPVGHFVVLTGYDKDNGQIFVTDPLHPNPLSEMHTYPVPIERLIGAIYLGVLTYDSNLVLIGPPASGDDA